MTIDVSACEPPPVRVDPYTAIPYNTYGTILTAGA